MSRPRRGVVIIPVLVCLVLIAALAASLVKTGMARRELGRDEQRNMQAEWLASSGLARAAARLADNDAYTGETWVVPAEELQGRDGASVSIVVEPVKEQPGRRSVRVRADYPADASRRARASKQAEVVVRPKGPKGGNP